MEGPQVVVSQVHQVLQGRVKLLQDALDPKGEEEGMMGRGITGPQKRGTSGPNENPPKSGGAT